MTLPPLSKVWSVSLYDQLFSRYRVIENRKCTEWPQSDHGPLTVKSTLYTLRTSPVVLIWSFLFYDQPFFEIQGYRKSEKSEVHSMTLEWHWTFNNKNAPCTLNTYPMRHTLLSVLLYENPFSTYNVVGNLKSQKCIKWPQYDLGHLMVKTTPIHQLRTPEAQILIRFALRPPFSRFKVVQNRKNWKCTEWTQTLNGQQYPAYTMYLFLGPKFWSVSLYNSPSSRYCTLYNSPLTIMLRAKKKKMKFSVSNFTFC